MLQRAFAAIAGIAVVNGVAAIAGIAVITTGLQQSLGLLSRAQGCSNRWDRCYEHKVAAIAGIAVITTGLQQSLGLLSRARGCGKCWPCRSKALRQKLILPFITVAADAGFCR